MTPCALPWFGVQLTLVLGVECGNSIPSVEGGLSLCCGLVFPAQFLCAGFCIVEWKWQQLVLGGSSRASAEKLRAECWEVFLAQPERGVGGRSFAVVRLGLCLERCVFSELPGQVLHQLCENNL